MVFDGRDLLMVMRGPSSEFHISLESVEGTLQLLRRAISSSLRTRIHRT